MRPLADELADRLRDLETLGLHRSLTTPHGVDFATNNYLGLADHPRLRTGLIEKLATRTTRPIASPASRLLRGNTADHLELEASLAKFLGTEAALIFSSGYLANVAVITTLVNAGDRVISDEENHASLIDGMRLSGARKIILPHLDVTALERALMTPHPGGRTFVVTESLFSMAGDIAPLDSYAELTRRHGAELIVDDAHAVGVYGDQRGSGLVEHFGISDHVLATLSTFGKALGLYGACVAGSRVVVDYLVNRARPFIFSTAPAQFFLAAVETALEIVAAEPERRQRVLSLARRLREALGERGIDCLDSSGPIVPVMVGDNERALAAAERIRREGFDVRAIRPPSVAAGTARLRISVHADHTEAQIDALAVILPPATALSKSPALAKSAGETSKRQAVT